jgi:UDP-N-acetylmuramyl pentapeptide phosphotransferase/UDP-N-acetylglucosamine-1-phosphate transferase
MPATIGLGGWLSAWFLLALAGTWAVRRYAVGRKLLDHPAERRSHRVATPRGGGLSIVIAMLLALLWLALMDPGHRGILVAAGGGLVLVAGSGWVDDHRPLSASLRLATHIAAACLVSGALLLGGHGAWSAILAAVAIPVLVNVWNFMDGIDGLAASQAAIAASFYALYATDAATSALAWALVAACCGFLPFNFPKARIFLGDVGSGALGYLLAFLLVWVWLQHEHGSRAAMLPLMLLPLAAFLVDASLTLSRRIVRGEKWWMPHVQHAYQQLASTLGAHWPVTLGYAAWSVLAGGMFLATDEQAFAIKLLLAAGWMLGSGLAWLALQRGCADSRGSQGSSR